MKKKQASTFGVSEEKTVNKRASTFGGGGPHRGGRSLYQVKRGDAGDGLRHGSGQVGGPRLGVPRSELAELWGFAASGGRSL